MAKNKKAKRQATRRLKQSFKQAFVMRDAVIRDRLEAGKPVDDLLPTNPEELAYLRKKFNLPDQVTPPPPPDPRSSHPQLFYYPGNDKPPQEGEEPKS
jgi:hypothetical protein